MSKVCRLCLTILHNSAKSFMINSYEPNTGFMPFRDQLTTCIPEMALDLVPNPIICKTCSTSLKLAYEFKNKCLSVEETIRKYAETRPPNSHIDLIGLGVLREIEQGSSRTKIKSPPIMSTELEITEIQDTPELVVVKNERIENLVGSSTIDSSEDFSAVTIDKINVTENCDTPEETGRKKRKPAATYNEMNTCGICFEVYSDEESFNAHKETHKLFNDSYTCNFCNLQFKSLQELRKHNSLCQANKRLPEKTSVLNKRPHLPTRAKNRLKKWLFAHTDHPYPTDHEKQLLMKETNLSLLQVENWFINARRRILQDMTRLKHLRGSRGCDAYLEFNTDEDHLNNSSKSDNRPIAATTNLVQQIKMEIEDR